MEKVPFFVLFFTRAHGVPLADAYVEGGQVEHLRALADDGLVA